MTEPQTISGSLDLLLAGLRAAGEATRLRLLVLLSGGELTVKEITEILGQSQPRISRHLKLLVEAGLVDRFREGSWAFYRLRETGPGAALAHDLVSLIDPEDTSLARDRERLAEIRGRRERAALAYFRHHAGEWDRVRSLHVEDALVEKAMLDAVGAEPVDAHLDLGTGTGRVVELFGGKARRALGVDVSHEMLNVARANLDRAGLAHVRVRQGDIYHLTYEPGSFDLVTLHQVLHFLDDPGGAIREAARMLAPGGRLLIVDFAPHEVEFLREEHAHRRLGFSDEEVETWLAASGLNLERGRELAPTRGSDGKLTVSLWLGRRAGAVEEDETSTTRPSQGEAA